MKSQWSDKKAAEYVSRYEAQGVAEDLALRVYTTRLLGRDPRLVLHGGGNTSVKTKQTDILGEEHDVLCVKGSGWDMGEIEPEGLPAVKLLPLLKTRSLDTLSDEDMVNFQRGNLMDSRSPNPSVETLLHAFLPHKFVDHTHSTAVLSLVDQPDGDKLAREAFGGRMGIVPYIMPGFALAKAAVDAYERNIAYKGLILLKHGIFTFGDSAQEAYELMVEMVSLAGERLNAKVFASAALPDNPPKPAEIAPIIRGACAQPDRFVMSYRNSDAIMNYVNGGELADYGQRGVVTPDHIIRTKNRPLILSAYDAEHVRKAVTDYAEAYETYFKANETGQTMLDPMPRIVLAPGVGMFALGKSARDAGIAADIAENTIRVITDAEALGRFEPLDEPELFKMEYWSLEQAKLGKGAEKPLARQVAVITGGAGALGQAAAEAFAQAGAEVALLDLQVPETGGLGIQCDMTDRAQVRAAFDQVCETYGGVDILVSNAGAAWQGQIGQVSDEILRQSFELNFFAHQTAAQESVRVMKLQGTGGCLLFNVSKQAVNPGRDFGPYGLPKAATMFLVRQYAVDHGDDGIRSNGVNADRIRSGILDNPMITERAKARGVSVDEYMRGNLLHAEVLASDVAQAFVKLALARKTTGHIDVVDGGNIAAALR